MSAPRILIIGAGALLVSTIAKALTGAMVQVLEAHNVCAGFDTRYFAFVDAIVYQHELRGSRSSVAPNRPIIYLTPGAGIEHTVKDCVSSPLPL